MKFNQYFDYQKAKEKLSNGIRVKVKLFGDWHEIYEFDYHDNFVGFTFELQIKGIFIDKETLLKAEYYYLEGYGDED